MRHSASTVFNPSAAAYHLPTVVAFLSTPSWNFSRSSSVIASTSGSPSARYVHSASSPSECVNENSDATPALLAARSSAFFST
jgi:hypothetical protein